MDNFDQKKHGQVIDNFLKDLSDTQGDAFILKGGTALLKCYNLDRFSEDIDLDGKRKNIKEFIGKFCKKYGYTYRIAKDTDTVKRAFINYGENKPLKVEVSYRRRDIPHEQYTKINGINVYTIDRLCQMKSSAYESRDKIRDLYDLCYIGDKYYDKLSESTKIRLQDALEYKGLEQFDYIIQNNEDPLIDKDKLAEKFLNLYDKVGLLYDKTENDISKDIGKNKSKPSQKRKLKLDIKPKDNSKGFTR